MLLEKFSVNINEEAKLYVEVYDENEAELKIGDARIVKLQDGTEVETVWFGDEWKPNTVPGSFISGLVYEAAKGYDNRSVIFRILNNDPLFDEEAYLKEGV